MPVFSATTWVDDTEQTVSAAACRVTAIEILPHEEQANEVYLQLFNSADPDPGTTAPNMVIPIGTNTTQGAGTANTWTTAGGMSRKRKVIFPGGGFRFGTACTAICTTTATGETAATTTSLPKSIRIFYVLGN